jgi:ppGpp synthetase/RelA/SpoT-type nucleotidyltranferase
MSELTKTSATEWYRANAPIFEGLSDVVATTLSVLLKSQNIDYLAVSARTKNLPSLLEKLDRKGYQDIEEVTDMVGVRVITYIESDVEKVCHLIESAFLIHKDKSTDKSKELQINEIGYRSVHYICELGAHRVSLPELAQFENLHFEIQVRTVLQHAWAEIEHDRSYKFAGELPIAIKRRLNLLAGCLEIVDREFDTLAQELDQHEKESKQATESGDLKGIELTSTSLSQFIKSRDELSILARTDGGEVWAPSLFGELKSFGVDDLQDFSNLFVPEFITAYKNNITLSESNSTRFVRVAMLYKDINLYFSKSWEGQWRSMPEGVVKLLSGKYGNSKVISMLAERAISVIMPDGTRRLYREPKKSSQNSTSERK